MKRVFSASDLTGADSADFSEVRKRRSKRDDHHDKIDRTTALTSSQPDCGGQSSSDGSSGSRQAHIIDEVFASVLSQSSPQSQQQQPGVTILSPVITSPASEIGDLRKELKQQHDKLATLTIQVSLIMSFLGITPSAAEATAKKCVNTSINGHTADQAICKTAQGGATSASDTAASNAQKPPQQVQINLKNVLRQTIQEEDKMKARKAKTVIVSGLEATSGLPDKDAVAKLLRVELEARPQIVYCKRLGQPAQGRVQPLLVAMSKADDAHWVVANAKQLRNSRIRTIRECVYINANLTKEQSRDAYEQRCKRRAAAEQRQPQSQQSTSQPASQLAQSTQQSGPVHTSIIIQNANMATKQGSTDQDTACQQSSCAANDDRSQIRLIYRTETKQPSETSNAAVSSASSSRDRTYSTSQTGPQVMECSSIEHKSADATAATATDMYPASQTRSKPSAAAPTHHSSSTLNPSAASYVSPCSDAGAGRCITATSA